LKELFTRIEILSPADVVWRILTDPAGYASWNPFIPEAEGELKVGALWRIKIQPPGQKPQDYRVRILKIEEQKELSWLGHFHVPGLIDGEHRFEIQPTGSDRIDLIQREHFRGVLVPLVWRTFLNTHLRSGFDALNQSLKAVAERISGH
jgi:hypothetical protein